MEKKNLTLIVWAFMVLAFLLVLNLQFTSADNDNLFWACFDQGEVRDYCDNPNTGLPYKPSKTCASSSGCRTCMSFYDEVNNCYISGNHNDCNLLVSNECGVFGANGTTNFDVEPPIITVHSPAEGEVFSSRKVLFDIGLNERSKIYYQDLINGRGRVVKLCDDCYANNHSYTKYRSLKEGQNSILFRAIDAVRLEGNTTVNFFVDSKKPKITKTYPKRGFSDGSFEVQFKEANPELLMLQYGNFATGFRDSQLDVDNDCTLSRTTYTCNTNVDLTDYNDQEIEYWFELTDIAGAFVESKHIDLDVDTTFPVLNNNNNFFEVNGKYVYFTLNITELNFDEAVYSYIDDRGRERDKRLCSRLKDGLCEKRVRFKDGNYDLTVQIFDDAGNSIGLPAVFEVNN
jgi:hypothetical protein